MLVDGTVMTEPTGARSRARSVVVGRTVAVLKSDGWLPLKVLNPSDKPVYYEVMLNSLICTIVPQ